MRIENIALEKIDAPVLDVRASIDLERLNELADSINEMGLLQPVSVKPRGGRFELVAGNRRRLACKQLGWAEIPAIVLEGGEGPDVVGARLHENLVRLDMTPVEEAAVYAELFERCGDLERVAEMAHRSLQTVERRLTLLSGDPAVRDAIHAGRIPVGVGEELNRVVDPGTRSYLLDHAIRGGVTVATAAAWRREYSQIKLSEINMEQPPEAPGADPAPAASPYICWLCGSDEEQHDMRVRMVHQTCERIARRQMAERQANGE